MATVRLSYRDGFGGSLDEETSNGAVIVAGQAGAFRSSPGASVTLTGGTYTFTTFAKGVSRVDTLAVPGDAGSYWLSDLAAPDAAVNPPSWWTQEPPPRIPATVLTTFASGHGWGSATGITQTSNDATVPGLGAQSMKLVTQANTYGFTRRTGLPAQDLTAKHPRLWLTVQNPAGWGNGSIALLAAPSGGLGSSNYFSWQINLDTVASGTSGAVMTPAGLMVCIDLPWASVYQAGSPAKTAVTDWQLNVNAANTAGLVVWVNGIDLVSTMPAVFPNGVVSLCLDDSYSGHWDLARPALAKYGYPATMFPILSRLGQDGALTVAQMRTLQDTFGWEVGAHASTTQAHDRFASMRADEVEADMRACAEWLRGHGFRSRNYAYPQGAFTPNRADLPAARLFRSARTINPSAIGAVRPANRWRMRSRSGVGGSGGLGVTSSGTTGTYGLLSAAKAGTGWVILTLHNVTSAASTNINTISAADLGTLVDSINGLGMEVATIDQVLTAVR